jgi:hypothetical protein
MASSLKTMKKIGNVYILLSFSLSRLASSQTFICHTVLWNSFLLLLPVHTMLSFLLSACSRLFSLFPLLLICFPPHQVILYLRLCPPSLLSTSFSLSALLHSLMPFFIFYLIPSLLSYLLPSPFPSLFPSLFPLAFIHLCILSVSVTPSFSFPSLLLSLFPLCFLLSFLLSSSFSLSFSPSLLSFLFFLPSLLVTLFPFLLLYLFLFFLPFSFFISFLLLFLFSFFLSFSFLFLSLLPSPLIFSFPYPFLSPCSSILVVPKKAPWWREREAGGGWELSPEEDAQDGGCARPQRVSHAHLPEVRILFKGTVSRDGFGF